MAWYFVGMLLNGRIAHLSVVVVLGACAASCPDTNGGPAGVCEVEDKIECDGQCVAWDDLDDEANCGACGNRCDDREVCVGGGQCGYGCACTSGAASCDAEPPACETRLSTDGANCGACGVRCGPGWPCVGGACVCGTSTDCPSGQACVANSCAPVASAPDDTGAVALSTIVEERSGCEDYSISAVHVACRGALDEVDARVVCRERGLDDAWPAVVDVEGAGGTSGPHIAALLCEGDEQRVAECAMLFRSEGPCPDYVGLGVDCVVDGGPSDALDAGG